MKDKAKRNAPHPTDPYQWFFPLGMATGLVGTGLWAAFHWKWIAFYPGIIHAELMIGGFFLIVAAGFLMTAIPRFTQSASAGLFEKLVVLVLALAIVCSTLLGKGIWSHALIMALTGFLIFFGLRRIFRSPFKPSPSFPLVGVGVFSAFVGSAINVFSDSFSSSTIVLGRLLTLYALPLGAMLGIGSQLLPRLMGTIKYAATAAAPTPLNSAAADGKKRWLFFLCGILLLATFGWEAFISSQAGRLGRALLVSVIVLIGWRIHHQPTKKGVLPWCLWGSSWMLLIGMWPGALMPQFHLHGAHIFFIGSVSLMIFSVATRVTLAHGGHGLEAEARSKTLAAVFLCLLIALTARLVAPFVDGYFNHLAYASLIWMAAAVLWLAQFLPKIILRKTSNPE